MRRKFLFLLALLVAVLAPSAGRLGAQCTRVGWVASVTPGCGAKIIDLNNAQVLHAFSGAEGLTGGQTFTFSTSISPIPIGCTVGNGLAVSLTCVSDTLPCTAHFGYFLDSGNDFTVNFEANVYDAASQICYWDFGDGSFSTGRSVSHGFAHQGEFNVCLTVSDAFGCSAQYCETVNVATQEHNWCGYNMMVTAVGTQLYGKLIPVGDQGANTIQSVDWYTSKSSSLIAQTPSFSAPLPGYGSYLVCAQYKVGNDDGSYTCASTQCRDLTVAEPNCINPIMADPTALCPGQSTLYAPVCGCNGVTYGNECEAISTGLSSWWAGNCSAMGGACLARMETKILSGNPDDGYDALFTNLSTGDYTFSQLDFGDGTPIWESTNWTTVSHHFPEGGVYRTNLTTWKTGGCVSSAIQMLVTDAFNMSAANAPESTDYVRPGDANRDGKANVYDVLNIGVGHYAAGAPRPDATTAWTPQFAPNWDASIANQVNYKHLDCDGNGAVNEFDADVIGQHYVPIDTTVAAVLPNTPQIRIEFPSDTVIVDAQNPAPLEIKGKILLGSVSQPALGIYGVAFEMQYPEFVGHNPVADYKSDYFGSPNHMLWLAKDNYNQRQLDIGLARKNGVQANGYGAIGEVTFRADFIIVIDVIERSSNRVLPFVVPINGVRAIDNQGNVKYISTPATLDTVWVKVVGISKTNEALSNAVVVAPNPASENATVYVGDLQVERFEMIDGFGRTLSVTYPAGQRMFDVDVKNLPRGVYSLKLQTDKGIVNKKLVVR